MKTIIHNLKRIIDITSLSQHEKTQTIVTKPLNLLFYRIIKEEDKNTTKKLLKLIKQYKKTEKADQKNKIINNLLQELEFTLEIRQIIAKLENAQC
jgi:hypothetical protein